MTRTAPRRKPKPKHKPVVNRIKPRRKTSEKAIYGGVVVIGFFAVMIAVLFTQMEYWALFSVGYLAVIAYLIHINVWHVYRARHLADWQQALAKIPLRFVGYGTKDGKPLEAAHDHPETLRAFIVSLLISIVILGLLGFAAWRLTM